LLASIPIVFWTTRQTYGPVAESKSLRDSAQEGAPLLTESSSALPSSLPEHPQKLVSPPSRSIQPPQHPTAEAQSTLNEMPEFPILDDPDAKENLGRQALSYVGADAEADGIWVWLINDPSLSPKVRQDLIEDLNENGFSDGNGRRPTVDDLPLIESRLLLIEEQAPFAMDEVNAAAFAEAYKDLANMWSRLTQ
jgi:hypothetical protein